MNHLLTFKPDGTATTLWTEAIALPSLGRLTIRRASTVEFNTATQKWEVRLPRRRDVLFAHTSRSKCLQWEQRYFNRL